MFIPSNQDPDIRVERTLNEESGTVHLKYFYKRKQLPAFMLDSKLSEQLAGYSLIEKDLETVINWLETIDKLYPDGKETKSNFIHGSDRDVFNIVKSLFVSSLTFYAKCFTNCPGRLSRLNRKMIADEFREVHDQVMMYRNSFAAHSGHEKLELAKSILVVNPLKNYELIVTQERAQPDYATMQGNVSFQGLANHLLDVVRAKQEKVYGKLIEDVLPNAESIIKKCKKPKGLVVQLNTGARSK
ncbi:hypothetical protein MA615_004330 [Vibrio vulnificus]|uniref:hypothetical protein n=1 Tax=Vibrio vulnificus TaxID=672 RepID=UPI001CDB913B|nr:hypothetical protein [Vibrio vulnificus]EHU4930554.1 hypothetical protein [Vibrio vulnificus]EHV9590101.1 hypothetical protein [Vibrio vulnificus]EIT7024425.1 hypothetical protein [Vibrio vulnificus]EIV8623050.1 hypothetical protein [Vibrio vulnificus]EKA7338867.1 hypothetical protein [Vibrio vulnificus]